MGGGLVPVFEVHYLGMCRGIAVPQVLGDNIAHTRDFSEFVANLLDGEIEMLGAHKENVVRLALPDGAEQAGHQLDQAARLFELLIYLEQRDNILEARMEGICSRDLV